MGRCVGYVLLPLLMLGLAGCASPPFAPVDTESAVSPSASEAAGLAGTTALWGGVVVDLKNLAGYTRMEVVSYPLRNQEPQTGRMTDGRFRLEVPGFLDPLDYRPGRRISARGRLERFEDGRIGEAYYRFPVLVAHEVHLWPETTPRERSRSGVNFGIGIGIGL